MNPLLVVAALQAIAELWKSLDTAQDPANLTPDFIEARNRARESLMILAETLK